MSFPHYAVAYVGKPQGDLMSFMNKGNSSCVKVMINGIQMVQGSNISMECLYSGAPLAKWLFLNYYGRNTYEYPSRNTYGSKSLILPCIRVRSVHGLNKTT